MALDYVNHGGNDAISPDMRIAPGYMPSKRQLHDDYRPIHEGWNDPSRAANTFLTP